ncbi:MAG TPA: DNA-binding protein [Clostridiaceae bacterium]|jgi:hypothetical protein|nr:DNA-binding protein [Clostridiaceae bacterium]
MALKEGNTRILLTLPLDFKDQLTEESKKDNRSLNNYIVNILINRKKD